MRFHDRVILLGLTAVWGLNFSVIAIALRDVPPLMLGALRFTLVAFPAVFLLPKPTAPWRHVALYGLTMFALQFALLFVGMASGAGAGVASLALQFQVFVTMALALWFSRERPSAHQVVGAVIGAVGLAVLLLDQQVLSGGVGLAIVLLAAVCWGVANTLSRRLLSGQGALSLVAWGSLLSAPPIALASLWVEGPTAWAVALDRSGLATWVALAYIVYPTTLLGFAVWAWQLRIHPVASVAPFTLLVPVFGLLFAHLINGELISTQIAVAAALVLSGLAVNQWGLQLVQGLHLMRSKEP
jgi:O-acetylserine/cysteine efflux transporter